MSRDEACFYAIMREVNSIPNIIRGYNLDKFRKSDKTQKALCMTLLNIGELVKGLSYEIKLTNSQVPWKEIAGMRDLAAHKYHSLNMDRIWLTVKNDIPEFKNMVQRIISELSIIEM